jgi:hypothetical protein
VRTELKTKNQKSTMSKRERETENKEVSTRAGEPTGHLLLFHLCYLKKYRSAKSGQKIERPEVISNGERWLQFNKFLPNQANGIRRGSQLSRTKRRAKDEKDSKLFGNQKSAPIAIKSDLDQV